MNAGAAPERVVLVAVELTSRAAGRSTASRVNGGGMNSSAESQLGELRALTVSAGGRVVGEVVQRRDAIDKTTFIGRGKAAELKAEVATTAADLVVFDNDLSPAQGKNLEDLVGVRVLDRSELILDIFAYRARTRESKLQVELAQLQYLLPRLKRMWTHLSRIRGGIGLRGPGETQLEVDRRVIRTRIATLKDKLSRIEERHGLQRKGRGAAWNVALVGYTNAGKSTIMNRLTGARLRAENRLFATLDATTRRVELPGGEEMLLTDTVGFIRDLPHHLVASFRATLEEVVQADLLLHVVDVSAPDHEEQMRIVREVLSDLGAGQSPVLHVFNKLDRVPATERAGVRARVLAEHDHAVVASAVQPRGLVGLIETLERLARQEQVRVRVRLPHREAGRLSLLYELGEVISRAYTEDAIEVELRARPEVIARLTGDGFRVQGGSAQ
ncbi:MAG TPA: GTPase HflX [Gemmatimonadota bacterium]|nr:GTPase HflX [Gemmatimonadota bacterium]